MTVMFFVVLPYLALVLAIGVGAYRAYARPFSYSSLSSQLLENRKLYWGSVPWHWGITLVLLAHLGAGLFPGLAHAILGNRVRLLVLECTGIGLSALALLGLLVLIARRMGYSALPRSVTSIMDGLVLALLLVQVASGLAVALFNRWGGLWYLHTAVPWFWSLVSLHPDSSSVASLPALVLFHFAVGFLLILVFPFSRLVHIIKFPLQYLWRSYQRVIWYRHG